jgi:hypothetical protein
MIRVEELGFMVKGLGLWIKDLRNRVYGFGFRVERIEFRGEGTG